MKPGRSRISSPTATATPRIIYSEIQPDHPNTFDQGVIGLTLAPGQTKPAADEWGTISAWAWGASRVLDYLETDPAVDAKRVALIGHSRLGKTVLWASAEDPRFALIYSSCAGEMGSSLARRDFGETVDDMAANYGYQFAGNFQKYPGHWNDMPVDTHMLIACSAPRPVFITGGTGDQWSDPKGEFLGEVAAGPVYRLVGSAGSGHDRTAAPRHAVDQRRPRLPLSHRRAHHRPWRLEGLPRFRRPPPETAAVRPAGGVRWQGVQPRR